MDQRRAAAALLALAACFACSAAAPTASNHTSLELHDGPIEGCYYNFQHYGEGDRIMTNEPCLNCTCHNRMLMCYLRVCPFTKAIGQDCTVEKRADQCCPIVTCPDVPVDLLTSTSTSSPAEYGTSGLGKLDKYGCSIHGKYFPEGSKVPSTPNKPCEHCYCIRNMTTCVMQECTLHVDGCTPIYHKDVCCPVRYSCDHLEDEILGLDDMTTTVRPTPGFLLTTTVLPVTQASQDCVHDDQIFPDGALIKTEKACEHCYCMKGDIVCVVQECGTPMENEGKNCTSLPPRHGQCCPDTYICEGDERVTDSITDVVELTTPPPRRIGVEGSGYRNEPDEPYTERSTEITDIEGSGEDFAIIPQTTENLVPEKGYSAVVDDTLYTTTESSLQYSQSTELDKGQNTIPDSVFDKETAQQPIQDKVTLSGFDDSTINATDFYTTARDLISQKDDYVTTESAFNKEDDIEITTSKEYEKVTTASTDLLDKTIFIDELIPTPDLETLKPFEQDQTGTTLSTEYTKVEETSELEILSTETSQSIVTEKNQFTNEVTTSSEADIAGGSTTVVDINVVVPETTSINPIVNEIDDNIPITLSPSRIPGEGDCLLNGITYSNNTSVPSTNNCHTGCKCISSIIKCDPIICSPPPEYLENMNDCHPVYDTPDSCCPTYVCSVKETVPPQSHSQMSGTDSPKLITVNECSGKDCIVDEEKESHVEPTPICKSGLCLDKIPVTQKECLSNDCKDQESVSKPQDCYDGKCQVSPVTPCEGENCNVESFKETSSEKNIGVNPNDVPLYVCSEKNGCKEGTVTDQDECTGEHCKRKETGDLDTKQPSGCQGTDCKLEEEPTVPPLIEQATETFTETTIIEKITQSTLSDTQKTEDADPNITTTKEQLTELDIEVTKEPVVYTDSYEKLPTTFDQITTETAKLPNIDKNMFSTDISITQTGTTTPEEEMKTEIVVTTESQKVIDSETSHKYDVIATDTPQTPKPIIVSDVQLTTEKDLTLSETTKHLETESEESFTENVGQFTTKKPHVYTDVDIYETISDKVYTKIPGMVETTEKDKTQSGITETVKEDIESDTPKTIFEKEDNKLEQPEMSSTEKETTYSEPTETSLQTTQIKLLETDKGNSQSEMPEAVTEKQEVAFTNSDLIVTEKDVQTAVTDTFTQSEHVITKAPETISTEKEVLAFETPADDKESIQTDTPEVLSPQTIPTIVTEIVTETHKIQTESPEPVNIVTDTIKTYTHESATELQLTATEAPKVTVTVKEEVQTITPEVTTYIEKAGVPDQQKIKLEVTTTHEFDQPLVEEQTTSSVRIETEEPELYQTTEQSSIKQQAPVTTKPEITGEDNKVGDKTNDRVDLTTETFLEVTTEHYEFYKEHDITEPTQTSVTKTEPKSEDSLSDVTELNDISTLSEGINEITTRKSLDIVTEDQELYTMTPKDFVTSLDNEDFVTTEEELLHTFSPDTHETKSDIISQFTEMTSEHDTLITDKYTESSIRDTDTPHLPIHDITEKHEKSTETLESYVTTSRTPERTTMLSELYTTSAKEISPSEKTTENQYTTITTDSEGYYDEKDVKVPFDVVDQTTIDFIEELTTSSSIQVITEKDHISTLDTSTKKQLDSESPDVATTIMEDSSKDPEISTELLIEPEITTLTSEHLSSAEGLTTNKPDEETLLTKYPYKETASEKLTTQQPHKQELDTSVPSEEVTETYIATSTKLAEEEQKVPEIEKQKEEVEKTTDETTIKSEENQDTDKHELELTPPTTVNQETDFAMQTEMSYATEKDISMSEEKISVTTELVPGVHLSELTHTDMLTTQASIEMTTKVSVPNEGDNIIRDNVVGTTIPESTTKIEQSTDVKDSRLTTESSLFYTTLGDKNMLTTITLDDGDSQKGEETYSDTFLTTISSQPEHDKKTTEQPMSLITDIDRAQSPETTEFKKDEDVTEEAIKSSDKPEPQEEIKHTLSPELPITELQTTNIPEQPLSHQELEPETSSKLPTVQDSSTLTHHMDKSTTSIIENEYSEAPQTTRTPFQTTELNIDVISDITTLYTVGVESTKGTVSQIDEGVTDIPEQKSTTELLPPAEKEPALSYEYLPPSKEPTDEIVTKSPYEDYTVADEIYKTTSKYPDTEHENDIKNTEGPITELQETITDYSTVPVYDMHTTLPEKETSETKGLDVTETPISSTEKEYETGTSTYESIVTRHTVKPIPVVTEIIHLDVIEKGQETNETETQPKDEEATTPGYLDKSTEKDYMYTQSKPLSETTEPNISTQASDNTDNASIEVDSSTQSSISKHPEHSEYPTTAFLPDSYKEKLDEHISYGTTELPEIGTSVTESQTELTDTVTYASGTAPEGETPKSVVTEKESESQTEKYITKPTIEKEAFTSNSGEIYIATEKVEALTDGHMPTDVTYTTLESSKTVTPSTTQTQAVVTLSKEQKETTEQEHEYSETTPFLVELKEHTHQIIDESSRIPTEEVTTARYVPQQTERGDQNLYVTDNYEDEHYTLLPIEVTQHVSHKEKPSTQFKEQTEQEVPTTISIDKYFTETVSKTEAVSTPSSTYTESDSQEPEKKPTTVVPGLDSESSAPSQPVSEKELSTTTLAEIITHPTPEPTGISTDKSIYTSTEETQKSEAPIVTTLSLEDIVSETPKATTSKTKEETATSAPIIDHESPQPEQKPITTTISPSHEVIKPGYEDDMNTPSPDFPPSGPGGYSQEPDYIEEDQAFGPGTCRYGGKVYVSAQQIPRDDPCDFCFCFRSDIICLQQSCPPPIHGCHEEPIQGFCCPRYECPVSMATTVNVTTTTTTTTTTLPPHFFPHAYKGAAQRRGCQIKGHTYKVGEVVRASSGPCLHCTCGGDGQMKCDPKACTPEPMLRQMIAAAVSAKRRR